MEKAKTTTKPRPATAKASAPGKSKPAAKAMSVAEVAKAFTAALKAGDFEKAEALWSDDVVSYEAMDGPMAELRGRKAVHDKGVWWTENHDIHAFKVEDPLVNGDTFVVRFAMDVTVKQTGERNAMDEIAVYKVKNCRIVEERFFY
jgi:ketosteroid isomerase-like protein